MIITNNSGAMMAKFLLLLSLGLNLVLAGMLLFSQGTAKHTALAVTQVSARNNSSVGTTDWQEITKSSTNVIAFRWNKIETDDDKQFLVNLRGLGCPEYVVRDLVIARLEDEFRVKTETYVSASADFQPWTGLKRRAVVAQADRAAERARADEESTRLHDLLGVNWDIEAYHLWRKETLPGIILGAFSDEEAPQLITLLERHDKASRRVREDAKGILIPSDLRQLRALTDQLQLDCNHLPTPAKVDELHLWVQGGMLQDHGNRFDSLDLTGHEMREIARLTLPIVDFLHEDILRDAKEPLSPDEAAHRLEGIDQVIAHVLGPQRFTEYQLAENDDYRSAAIFLHQKNLPKTAAVAVSRIFADARDQAAEIRADKNLADDERRTALAVLGATLKNNVNAALGANADEYLKNHGQLLDELVPPAKPEPRE